MRTIRKISVLLLVLSMALLLGSCGGEGEEPGKSLYEQGLEIVSLMQEMAGSDEYIGVFSASPEIKSILLDTAQGNFSQPKAVYQIKVSESAFPGQAELDLDGLSQSLQKNLQTRAASAVFVQVNALAGAETLAAASVCTAGKTFVNHEVTGSVIYLYVYENAAPAAITFSAGEDSAVSASGTFVLYDGFQADTKTDIEEFLAEFDAQVEEVAI